MDGELVAQLTPMQRVDMIQKGYVPGHEEDVRRYFDGLKPVGDAHVLATHDTGGGFSMNSMGEKNIKGNFNMKQVHEDEFDSHFQEYNLNEYEEQIQTPVKVNPRDSIKQTMDTYTKRESTLDSKVGRILGNREEAPQRRPIPQRQTQQDFMYEETEEEVRRGPVLGPNAKRPVQQPSTQRQSLPQRKTLPSPKPSAQPIKMSESLKPQIKPVRPVQQEQVRQSPEQVKKQGYSDGVKYLNSFIRLLKTSSVNERDQLTSILNYIIEVENSLTPNMVAVYREGLKQAEQKVYEQIKTPKS